jgi:FMN-dependent NADH-azoreductase
MATILHIDSSPRGERSKSRKLAKEFVVAWQVLHPDDVIIYRDLRQTPVPHITEEWIAAAFTPPEALTSEMVEILKFSDELVDEFLAADRCVFSVPMHNFSIPSNFKAYIDRVVRVGRTFIFEDGQFIWQQTRRYYLLPHEESLTGQVRSMKDGIVKNLLCVTLFNI